MELVPILATIILMATISTFFLAIGAYILFKIREKRGVEAKAETPATVQAELVTPEMIAEAVQHVEQQRAPVQQIAFEKPRVPSYKPADPIFVQRKVATPAPTAAPAPQRVAQVAEQVQQVRAEAPRVGPGPGPGPGSGPRPSTGEAAPGEKKFMKYTSEGYVSAKEEKKTGVVKWR